MPRLTQAESFQGSEGKITLRVWPNPDARQVVVVAHGYGEHMGRYAHVAQRLVAGGASVGGPDHLGHGCSDGERVLPPQRSTMRVAAVVGSLR